MPSRWVIRLNGRAGPIPLTAPMAVLAGWLDDPSNPQPEHSPVATPVAPHAAAGRPWALSPPQPLLANGDPLGVLLEVRVLDDALSNRLLEASRPGRRVRLGHSHLVVATAPQRLERTTWEAMTEWSGQRAWQLAMLSPTAFRNGNRTSPWPAPEPVARGLLQRWQALRPDMAPRIDDSLVRGMWVSDVDGRNEVVPLNGKVVSGFVGRLRYVCDGSDAEAAAFHALMSFAAYAGVGSHTTYGFGTVAPEPTWQPPSVRNLR